jgi:hypothetical protein
LQAFQFVFAKVCLGSHSSASTAIGHLRERPSLTFTLDSQLQSSLSLILPQDLTPQIMITPRKLDLEALRQVSQEPLDQVLHRSRSRRLGFGTRYGDIPGRDVEGVDVIGGLERVVTFAEGRWVEGVEGKDIGDCPVVLGHQDTRKE